MSRCPAGDITQLLRGAYRRGDLPWQTPVRILAVSVEQLQLAWILPPPKPATGRGDPSPSYHAQQILTPQKGIHDVTTAPTELKEEALGPQVRANGPTDDRAGATAIATAPETQSVEPQVTRSLFQRWYPQGMDRFKAAWVAAIHVGLLAAPLFFSWHGVLLALALHWITGGLGICLGFHRLFTHTSFQTVAPVRWALAVLGGLAGEGSVIDWVATHRAHHALSDQDGDPHSPRDGAWWSHVFWIPRARGSQAEFVDKWAPDLKKDPALRFISRHFLTTQIMFGLLVLGAGMWLGGWRYGVSLTCWGIFFRLALVWHSTWLVNSASHMWGYRNYETSDDSRNNWFVALVTYGEGWHNNHHAYPRMANHGHKWWEIDPTYTAVRLLSALGLAWNVVDYRNHAEKVA